MNHIKRITIYLFVVTLLFCTAVPGLAVDDSMAFDFSLTVDGKDIKQVQPGDIITVVFTLKRTDSNDNFTMYSMQDEITYDPEFFEILDGAVMTKDGVATTDILLLEGKHSFYMNAVSMSGGEAWGAETLVGSFQLKVLATEGTAVVENRNCIVGIQSGRDSYVTVPKNLTVVVSTECSVHFETYNGTPIPDQTVKLGEKIQRPEDPVWEGHYLENWYKDWYLTEPWDFDNDVVQGNMTLYAKYAEGIKPTDSTGTSDAGLPAWLLPVGTGIGLLILLILLLLFLTRIPVVFAQAGGAELKKIRVRRSGKVVLPKELAGKTWYKDAALTQPWNFEEDTITEKTTLYTRE